MGDILVWLHDEERRLRERIGAAYGDSPQYHVTALTNQADRFAEAAREIERLRALLPAATAIGGAKVATPSPRRLAMVTMRGVNVDQEGTMKDQDAAQTWTQERLLELSRGFQQSRILMTGAELDLFSLLAETPMKAPDVAGRLGADAAALTIVLDALAAMGLLIKRDGAYLTEPAARELLTRDRPGTVLPMIQHGAHLWSRWGELTRIVGGPRREPVADDGGLRSFIGAMHVIAAPQAARIVSLVGPGSATRLLDVGGASGSYTLAFLEASPALRATLFDRPPVVEMARERLGAAGVLDRVALVAGDFYADPLPAGHDLVFISAIIHQNTPAENVELFGKAFAALEPGGRIVVRDHVLDPDRTRPTAGALFAVNMLVAENGGNSYTFAEIEAALVEAGFERVRLLHPDQRMDGLVEAFRPAV